MQPVVASAFCVLCQVLGDLSTPQPEFEENMKVNMNIIVGGTDDILDNILSAARTVRKEMKKTFDSVEIEALQKMDICVCLSGNVSK